MVSDCVAGWELEKREYHKQEKLLLRDTEEGDEFHTEDETTPQKKVPKPRLHCPGGIGR